MSKTNVSFRVGDLVQAFLDGEVNTFAHGANCYKTMGAGIAAQVAKRLRALSNEDKKPTNNFPGGYTCVRIGFEPDSDQPDGMAFNLYTQVAPGPNAKIEYIVQALKGMRMALDSTRWFNDATINIPWIGCGIGGLNREEVLEAIQAQPDMGQVTIWSLE